MLLFDSSGVNPEASLTEHREALRSVMTAAKAAEADPLAGRLRPGLAHGPTDGPDSAAIEIPRGREADAGLVVDATAASVTARAVFDPGLLAAG